MFGAILGSAPPPVGSDKGPLPAKEKEHEGMAPASGMVPIPHVWNDASTHNGTSIHPNHSPLPSAPTHLCNFECVDLEVNNRGAHTVANTVGADTQTSRYQLCMHFNAHNFELRPLAPLTPTWALITLL